ncbi:MAG: HEAT repeat domain-containing protein [Myxococcota bacterium]
MRRTCSSLAVGWVIPAVLSILSISACNEPRYLGRTVSSWMVDLDSDTDHKRRQACEALAALGPQASKAIAKLIELLEDVNEGVQEFARDALAKMGPDSVAPLEEILHRPEPALRLHAAAALVQINPDHPKAASILVDAVTGIGNAELAQQAKDILIKLRDRAVPLLVPRLHDTYAPVRLQIVETLGDLKAAGHGAIDPLATVAQEDAKIEIRVAAITAMAKIGPKEKVAPVFTELLEDENEEVGAAAGSMLLYIGAREGTTGMVGVDESALERTVIDNAKLSAENTEPDPEVEETGIVKKKPTKKKKKKKRKK